MVPLHVLVRIWIYVFQWKCYYLFNSGEKEIQRRCMRGLRSHNSELHWSGRIPHYTLVFLLRVETSFKILCHKSNSHMYLSKDFTTRYISQLFHHWAEIPAICNLKVSLSSWLSPWAGGFKAETLWWGNIREKANHAVTAMKERGWGGAGQEYSLQSHACRDLPVRAYVWVSPQSPICSPMGPLGSVSMMNVWY